MHSKEHQHHHSPVHVSIIWEGYIRSGIMSLKKSWHSSLHHSSFFALTTAIPCSLAFLHLPWRLCNEYRMPLLDLCSIVTGGRTLLQHCSGCTGCSSSTASSSRSRRWCTTFYMTDVRHISPTWLHSTQQTLDDINSGCHKPELQSWNGRQTQFGKRTFSACGPSIWNSLFPAVRNIDSHPVFRRALKSHLLYCAPYHTIRSEWPKPLCFYCITFTHLCSWLL